MERVNAILAHPTFRRELAQLEELERQRPFCRHGLEHLLSVARWMVWEERRAPQPLPQELLYAAALLHDLGRGEQYRRGTPHEAAGVALVGPILEDCGFAPEERERILTAIAAHRKPPSGDRLGELLYRADKKSRPCFACPAIAQCNWPADQKNLTLEF